MKVDLKIAFLLLVILSFVSETAGRIRGGGFRSGSRSGSSFGRHRSGSRIGSSFGRHRSGSRIGSSFGSFRSGIRIGSSSGRRVGGFPHDIKTKAGLTNLYNSKVTKVKHVQRPLFRGWLGKVAAKYTPLKHTGVVATTNTGKNWLIHKGKNYGKSSQTVVVDAKHMRNKWTGIGSKKVGGVRITDYVKAGGKNYRLSSNNCQHASCRMFKLKG